MTLTIRPLGSRLAGLLVLAPFVAAIASAADWNQWGRSPLRNNTPDAHDLPTEWETGVPMT